MYKSYTYKNCLIVSMHFYSRPFVFLHQQGLYVHLLDHFLEETEHVWEKTI